MNRQQKRREAAELVDAAITNAMSPAILAESSEERLRKLEKKLRQFEATGWPDDELQHHIREVAKPFTPLWQRLVLVAEERGVLTLAESLQSGRNLIWLQDNGHRREIAQIREAWYAYLGAKPPITSRRLSA